MKFKKMMASILAFATMFTTVMPSASIFAEAAKESVVLTVGKDDGEYATINAALDKIKSGEIAMPTSEAERIYINVDPGVYEEQVIFDNCKYITLRQTPNTDGIVRLSWYYCTGYTYSNCDLDGNYDPTIDWSNPGTWYGYDDVAAGTDAAGNYIKNDQEAFTPYRQGQVMTASTVSYYDKNNVAHKDIKRAKTYLGSGFNLDAMAPICVKSNSTDITLEDLHIVNSIPVMVTQGEKDANITPEENPNTKWKKPSRDNLAICDEDTEEIAVPSIDTTTSYNLINVTNTQNS